MTDERRTLIKTASYEAEPGDVGRVLLLYSGGLDTSVMLKWIQDEYDAEVVALTVNLGQPGEDFEVVKGKALNLGALDCFVTSSISPGMSGSPSRLYDGAFESLDCPWNAR